MGLRNRIIAALAVTGIVPVLLLGWMSLSVNRDEVVSAVHESQARAAGDLSARAERFVLEALRGLKLGAGYLPLDRLAEADLPRALDFPYRQLPYLNVLVLLDGAGRAVAPPLAARESAPGEVRDRLTDADLRAFAEHVPLEAALAAGSAVGPPYRAPSGGSRVGVAVRVAGTARRVLAAEVSLGEIDRALAAAAGADGRAFLVDAGGELVADGGGRAALEPQERALATGEGPDARVLGEGGDAWLAARAPVGELGWTVVASRRAAVALRGAERVGRYTLFWAGVALLLTASLGLVLARGVVRPVRALAAAARDVTLGRYDVRLGRLGGDELGRLAEAFDHMAEEVRRRDEAQRGWSAELERRVEERTRALRDAQEQMARTRRLAALGSLGAGVAHALHNPMTALVGLVTLARNRAGAGSEATALLDDALLQARRVTRVVRDLRRHVELEHEGLGRAFPLGRPVLAALDAHRERIAARGIELRADVPAELPAAHGHAEQIEQLVSHLVDNAIEAMPDGGRLDVAVDAAEGGALRLRVSDSGRGIPPELRDRIFDPFFTTCPRAGAGLGLSLSHGIVQAHGGSIRVDGPPEGGTCFTVLLPSFPPGPHLA
jgi:signal transduction histidine kinase